MQLAERAFFSALEELPVGHSLRAQAARNHGIMQFMAANTVEATKTFFVALSFCKQALDAGVARRQELERAGRIQEALPIAKEEESLASTLEQLRKTVFGDDASG